MITYLTQMVSWLFSARVLTTDVPAAEMPELVPEPPDPYHGDSFMPLDVEVVDHTRVPGIYGKNKNRFAKRLSFMQPEAHDSFIVMQKDCDWKIVLSDMWRSSLSSLARRYPPGRRMRRHTKPPAFSGHNKGLSIDIDVKRTMALMEMTKRELDGWMAEYGWYCHRRDHKLKSEDWHYNYLDEDAAAAAEWLQHASRWSTAGAIEAKIKGWYSSYWAPSKKQLQRYLQYLNIYEGEIDGVIGNLSHAAIRVFQGAWHLKVDGVAGSRTCRTLAFRCAELRHRDIAALKDVQKRIT